MTSKKQKLVEKSIRGIIRETYTGRHFQNHELKEVVKSIIVSIEKDIPEEFEAVQFMVRYIHQSNDKYYFNLRKLQHNSENKQQFIELLTENKPLSSSPEPKEILDTEDISTEELEKLLEKEISNQTKKKVKLGPYRYPIIPFERVQHTGPEYGPFGTQWIYDTEQTDDILDDVLEKRSLQFDALRSIILPEQRSEAWFKMRKGKITASSAATALNKNPYEPQYTFILKKCTEVPFTGQKNCYHGKKYEEIATMMYEERMNVHVEEFGLIGSPIYDFIGASPDGICSRFKHDQIHLSKYVGRMLEIKCPATRAIKKKGNIKGDICPEYYWIQVQLQLECCDLEECDFLQCKIVEYANKYEFLKDTDPNEPFRSISTGFEKGCVIQLMPKNKLAKAHSSRKEYWDTVYDCAEFMYPDRLDLSPVDYDKWISDSLNEINTNPKYYHLVFDCVKYWKMDHSFNVTVPRDRQWFAEALPKLKKMWDYVEFFRAHDDKLKIWLEYIDAMKGKKGKDKLIMNAAEMICNVTDPDYDMNLAHIISFRKEKPIKIEYQEKNKTNKTDYEEYDFTQECYF